MSAVQELLLNARNAGPEVSPVDAVMGEDWAALDLGRPRALLRAEYLSARRDWTRGRGRKRIVAGALNRSPHAMVKLIGAGGASNGAGLRAQIAYLSRNGGVALRMPESNFGAALDEDDVANLARSWGLPERQVGGAARTSHFIVSFPAGSDPAAAERAGRAWAFEMFDAGRYGERWDYYTAFHTDTPYPHMHVVVNRRGLDEGLWLKVSARGEITFDELRAVQAEVAAREGIELIATPRLARGVHDRPVPDAEYRRAKRDGREPDAPEHTPESAVLAAAQVVGFARQYEGDAAILRAAHPELAARLDDAAATLMNGQQIETARAGLPGSGPKLNEQDISIITGTIEDRRAAVVANFAELDRDMRRIPDAKTRSIFLAQLAAIKGEAASYLRDREDLQTYRPDQVADRYRNPASPGGDPRTQQVRAEADRSVAVLAREAGLDPDAAVRRHEGPLISRGLEQDYREQEHQERALSRRSAGQPTETRIEADAVLAAYHGEADATYLAASEEIRRLLLDPDRVYRPAKAEPGQDRDADRQRPDENTHDHDPHGNSPTRGRRR